MEIIEFQTLYITELGQVIQINQGIERDKSFYSTGSFYNTTPFPIYVRVKTIGFQGTKQIVYVPPGKAITFENVPIQTIEVPANIDNQNVNPNLVIQITSFLTDQPVIPKIDTKAVDIKRPSQYNYVNGSSSTPTFVLTVPEGYLWKILNIQLEFQNTTTATTTYQVFVSEIPIGNSNIMNHTYNFLFQNVVTISPSLYYNVFIGQYIPTNTNGPISSSNASYQLLEHIELYPNEQLYFNVSPDTLVQYYVSYIEVPLEN